MKTYFSVVTSVYRNDKPDFVRCALESIISLQTLKPSEVVLVVDGPVLQDMANILKDYHQNSPIPFNIIWLPENVGLGTALRVGVEAATYDIVARMDADDVALPDRFEKQISFLVSHPEIAVLGGQIAEFIGNESNIVGYRYVPCEQSKINKMIKIRCPFNHVSVMFRRDRVLEVGNYMDWHFNEDYFLWIRMFEYGCKFANLPDTLVNVRIGKEMYARRGGLEYFKSEKGLQNYMLKKGIINFPRYAYNVFGRFIIQVLLPNSIRAFVFKTFFRNHAH